MVFKYVLMSICYFSKYPEAILLKKVDEQSVVSGMINFFSCTGLPSEILTDERSVFVDKLMKQLCTFIPLERQHIIPKLTGYWIVGQADLLSMLKRAAHDRIFTIPMSSLLTGKHFILCLSPFQLIYGHIP